MGIRNADLHFGTRNNDPNGIRECTTCHGRGVRNGRPCPSCHTRQQLRNAWHNSGPGPHRIRRVIDNL